MKAISAVTAFIAAACLCPALAFAQTKPVEPTLAGVMVDLVELNQTGGALRLAIHFVNRTDRSLDPPAFPAEQITLTDMKSRRKYFALRDPQQQFLAGSIASAADGGHIALHLAPNQAAVMWAYFDAVAPGTTMTVEMPFVQPIENVPITSGPPSIFANTTAVSESTGTTATVTSAKRSGDSVSIVVKLALDRGATLPPSGPIDYKKVFLFDSAGKREYSLMQDKQGMFQAEPLTSKADGGSFTPDWRKPMTLDLQFQAPPDPNAAVDLFIPGFLPVVGVAVEPDPKAGKKK